MAPSRHICKPTILFVWQGLHVNVPFRDAATQRGEQVGLNAVRCTARLMTAYVASALHR